LHIEASSVTEQKTDNKMSGPLRKHVQFSEMSTSDTTTPMGLLMQGLPGHKETEEMPVSFNRHDSTGETINLDKEAILTKK